MDQWAGFSPNLASNLAVGLALVAPALALLVAGWAHTAQASRTATLWRGVQGAIGAGLIASAGAAVLQAISPSQAAWGELLAMQPLSATLAVLVQGLAAVIASFSGRYLQGDTQGLAGQRRYASALAGVLASVQVLLLADHWVLLIAAWAAVGACLQHLLCFYADRPFALLAAHKKRLADRLADVLLLGAAALAWQEAGSGSLSHLAQHVAQQTSQGTVSLALQTSAVLLVLAVVLRTALLPVHGWIIQVMEAPTPVSALLHAGVVNLGGWVLIRQSSLIEASPVARWLLVGLGAITALLAGMVMMTRISIKVRLAWSTVAQMGFMVMECGLGLYTLAALHLLGHSLYKAHAFLSSSSTVQQTRLQQLRGQMTPSAWSLLTAPALTLAVVAGTQAMMSTPSWPWWWTAVLAWAWAPLLWVPANAHTGRSGALVLGVGATLVAGLALLASLAHALPLGLSEAPHHAAGWLVALAMGLMYAALVALQRWPQGLSAWRRWSYAGFYMDEVYTRITLSLWPARWTPRKTDQKDEWAPSSSLMATQD
ncbi:NADH-quinone oxidoreductase subunit L [Aquabacterium sp. NJ1]|uniref:NADH-quinone oxidoreductase subunit L n=1 Tax=Aquabacterium sp. NJ1 TaxID=1538295 RepID=UPI00068A2AA1|nr:NADH-quinone oxidoreductase subunit L [Aquabacterium sp. NJ1]